MVAAPLASYEQVKHVQDDQVRHLGQLSVVSEVPVSWPRLKRIAQKRERDGCLGVGDPIDGPAHLRESRYFGDGVQPVLRPEYERERAILVHGRFWLVSISQKVSL